MARVALLICVCLSSTHTLSAAEFVDIKPRRNARLDESVKAEISCFSPSKNACGYGYVHIFLTNALPKKRTVTTIFTCRDYFSGGENLFRVKKSVELAPSKTGRVIFPFPRGYGGGGQHFRFILDGTGTTSSVSTPSVENYSALLVTDKGTLKNKWEDYLAPLQLFVSSSSRSRQHWSDRLSSSIPSSDLVKWSEKPFGTPLPSSFVNPNDGFLALFSSPATDIPSTWKYLTGFSLIIVDCRTPSLTAEKQRAIVNYEKAGGGVILQYASALGDGPLRTMVNENSSASSEDAITATCTGGVGFGTFIAVPDASGSGGRLKRWIDSYWNECDNYERGGAFNTKTDFHPAAIPGIEEVPILFFFLLIIAFVIVAGPVNFLYCLWKKRKPALLLLTLPASGFGFTLFILGYGFLSEGFSIKGVIVSSMLLDQEKHEKVEFAARSLYAGLPPSSISPQPDTLTSTMNVFNSNTSKSIEIDLDAGGRISGDVLTARTPSALSTLTIGRARERLRFQKRPDGGLNVLAGPDFRPKKEVQPKEKITTVMRDFDGSWYAGTGSGPLTPGAGHQMFAHIVKMKLAANKQRTPYDRSRRDPYGYQSPRYYRRREEVHPPQHVVHKVPHSLNNLSSIKPGSYVAVVEAVPSCDTLGLNVQYMKEYHLVYGILAQEDIVE